jgi:hypothetical protein
MTDTRHKGPAPRQGRRLALTMSQAEFQRSPGRKHPLVRLESPVNPAVAEEIRQGVRTRRGKIKGEPPMSIPNM